MIDEIAGPALEANPDAGRNKQRAGQGRRLGAGAGVEIKGVKAASLVDYCSSPVMPHSASFAASAAESITTPVIPGEQSVTATVGVL